MVGMKRTDTTARTLRALLDAKDEWTYGASLAKAAQIRTGTLHPILTRLEENGWIEARWEDADPSAEGRPRRRYVRLTEYGRDGARQWLTPDSAELRRYRKRAAVIEAVQWHGDNWRAIRAAFGNSVRRENSVIVIRTMTGETTATIGQWVARGARREVYKIEPHVFADVYEPAD